MAPALRLTGSVISAHMIAITLSACTTDTARRTGFETVQNLGAMHCIPELGDHCPPRLDYQGYQQDRDKLNSGEVVRPDQTESCSICARQHRGTSPTR